MATSLINKSWALLKSSGLKGIFIIYYSIDLLIDILTSWILTEIIDGKENYILCYILLKTIYPLISEKINSHILLNIKNKIGIIFFEESLSKYNNLSFSSKNKTNLYDFEKKMKDASSALIMVIDWGLPQFINLISSLLSCLIIFVRQELYLIGIIILAINIIIYYNFIKKLQDNLSKERNITKKNDNMIRNAITLYLPLFQYKEKNVSDILQLEEKILKNSININKQWNDISLVTSLTNNMGMLIFGLFYKTTSTDEVINSSNIVRLLLIINTLYQFRSSVARLMSFINWYGGLDVEYINYENFWKELEFADEPVRLSLPKSLDITNIDIINDNFKLSFDKSTTNICINEGDRILIRGESGQGKTTFINSLMGKIKGIQLSYNNTENYHHHFVEFYQVIKEKMPTSTITVRQLFCNESDDDVIDYCCKLCNIYDYVHDLTETINNSNDDAHINVIITQKNVYDIEIDERISGGQKSRLALATRIYRLLKENKRILILDEPEQGLDPKLAYQVIHNILELCKEKNITIITISHLESINQKYNWDKQITIQNGFVSLDK